MITSGLHEDGLADAVDGFGGGWSAEQVLAIMRDSRIGSFGAIAITLSLLARFLLLSNLPSARFVPYVISAHVLCRWTTLPLGYFLRSARTGEGQGGRMAERIPGTALAIGSAITFPVVGYFMRTGSWVPIAAATVITALTGLYYQKRIGGVTGDCFGATNQLTEIAIYFCGVWRA